MQNNQIPKNTLIHTSQKELLPTGKTEFLKPTLEVIQLDNKIPLTIPSKVLNQMRFLCKNIWEVEWSGILFYSTQGEFGTEAFKIQLETIFPMNKGNATYTEFETNEDFVEFLMDNPENLQFNRGLIHSHNLMSVFFSGTDNSEINDNSEFHNYYLSLIVNNKEDICAKVAFRGKNNEEIKRVVNYKGNNGIPQTMVINSTVEKDVIFHYTCSIIKQEENTVSEEFAKRTQEIIKNALKKAESFQKSLNQFKDKGQQTTMFDNWDKGYQSTAIVEQDDNIEDFTSVLISLDRLNSESLENTLKSLKKKFGNKLTDKNETEVNIYTNSIAENFNKFYHDYFDDKEELCVESTLEGVCELLEEHAVGNWVADVIYTKLVVLYEKSLTEEWTL